MNHHTSSTRKRKDRGYKGSFVNSQILSPIEPTGFNSKNRLLAGYMAHEFLTTGTLFGQKFDPARAESMPVSVTDPAKRKQVPAFNGVEPVEMKPVNRSYAEVAQLLKGESGAHIAGIINPTQLARWIQM